MACAHFGNLATCLTQVPTTTSGCMPIMIIGRDSEHILITIRRLFLTNCTRMPREYPVAGGLMFTGVFVVHIGTNLVLLAATTDKAAFSYS